jgi:hypothetical protein
MGEPPTLRRPDLFETETRVERNIPNVVHAHARPWDWGGDAVSAFDPDSECAGGYARRLNLRQYAAIPAQQLGQPSEQGMGVSADPDVSVEQEGRGPTTRGRNTLEDRAEEDRRPPPDRDVHGAWRNVNAERDPSTFDQSQDVATGPTSDVQNR